MTGNNISPTGHHLIRAVACTAALLVALAVGGCNVPDPCARLAAPTPNEIATVQGGAEVERPSGGTDCDLLDGRWQQEQDD
jgi:hypothetical protein